LPGLQRIAEDLVKVQEIVIEVAENLDIRSWLAHQHAGRAAEGLAVQFVGRQVLDDERRHQPFATHPAQEGTCGGGHSVFLPSARSESVAMCPLYLTQFLTQGPE
jgi:hypothetical protein